VAPTLAQVFASAGDSTSPDTAFATLFRLWNAEYQAGPTDPCTQAETKGLYCGTLQSSLAQLRAVGRPAILMLGEGGVALPGWLVASAPMRWRCKWGSAS
jgi:hypothetical protein